MITFDTKLLLELQATDTTASLPQNWKSIQLSETLTGPIGWHLDNMVIKSLQQMLMEDLVHWMMGIAYIGIHKGIDKRTWRQYEPGNIRTE